MAKGSRPHIMQQIYEEVENERQRTYERIRLGELPNTMRELDPMLRLAVLLEEVGEIAELVKVAHGLKPRKAVNSHEIREYLQNELIQVAAIAVDWLQCDR